MTACRSATAAELRASIEAALPYSSASKMRLARREAFIREAEGLAAAVAGYYGSRSKAAPIREQANRVSDALARAIDAAATDPDADSLMGFYLSCARSEGPGPSLEVWDRSSAPGCADILLSDLLRDFRARVQGMHDVVGTLRPRVRSALLHTELESLAWLFESTLGKIPTATAADRSRKTAKPESEFEKIARAFCKAVGFPGMRHATLVRALAEYRNRKARGTPYTRWWVETGTP